MMNTFLPDDVPLVEPPAACTVTVLVTVFVLPQAVAPNASSESAAIETRSRLRDIAYLPLLI